MKSRRTLAGNIAAAMSLLAVVALLPMGREARGGDRPAPTAITVAISHRVFVNFHDTLTVAMNERRNVGDTEFTFELVEFYPDFAIDTTRTITSVTDDPNNPAFKVAVYESGEMADDTWAFYGIDIPHYGRNSYLAFKVLGFEYRGVVLGRNGATAVQAREAKKE